MPVTIQTGPDEETPLLAGHLVPAVEQTSESTGPGSEAAALTGHLDQGSRTPTVKGKTNVGGAAEVVKRTPLPWQQLSIVLFLQLAEPLTSQVIYPVGPSPIAFALPQTADQCLFHSLHPRLV